MSKIGFSGSNLVGISTDGIIEGSANKYANAASLDGWLKGLYYGKIKRNSTTELQIEAREAGTEDFAVVTQEIVSLATPKTVNTSANLIAADGTDSGSPPVASTLYYLYLSNSTASYAPSSLRLSAFSPTNSYLAASGNGAKWRFVGAIYLNASIQLAHQLNVAGMNQSDSHQDFLAANIVRNSGIDDLYEIQTISNIVCLPGQILLVFAVVIGHWNVAPYTYNVHLFRGTTALSAGGSANAIEHIHNACPLCDLYKPNTISEVSYISKFHYNASANTITTEGDGSSQTKLNVFRSQA